MAALNGHTECVKLLIPVSNCTIVLKHMTQVGYDVSLLQQCIEDYEAIQQKKRLHNSLVNTVELKTKSVKRKI